MSNLSSAYETFLIWHDELQLTRDEVRERVGWADWSFETWAEWNYWCVLFYGKAIFE